MGTPEAKIIVSYAKANAWNLFVGHFPNADTNQFVAEVGVDEKHNLKVQIFFLKIALSLQSVFVADRKFWNERLKTALRVTPKQPLTVTGFSYQLSAMKAKTALPIPPMNFTETAPSLSKIFSVQINVYVTPDRYTS